jgi:hypothetical protein
VSFLLGAAALLVLIGAVLVPLGHPQQFDAPDAR